MAHIEMHKQVFPPCSILSHRARNGPVPCPFVPASFTICSDLVRRAENLSALGTSFDFVDCSIEMRDLAIRRENRCVEQVGNTALRSKGESERMLRGVKGACHTVMTAPRITIPKLKVCCVVLAAFSRMLRSVQETRPSSLATVTCRREVFKCVA